MAPYLQGGGLRRQVVLEGNRLVLTCLAGGSWPLQYRWTFNNSNITDWTSQYRSVIIDWFWGLSEFSMCMSAYVFALFGLLYRRAGELPTSDAGQNNHNIWAVDLE